MNLSRVMENLHLNAFQQIILNLSAGACGNALKSDDFYLGQVDNGSS